MKNKIQILGLIFAFSLAFTSCEKDNDLNPQENSLISNEGESKERGITNKSAYPITLNINLTSDSDVINAANNLQSGEYLVGYLGSNSSQLAEVTDQLPVGYGPTGPNGPTGPGMREFCTPLTDECLRKIRAANCYNEELFGCSVMIIDPDLGMAWVSECDD